MVAGLTWKEWRRSAEEIAVKALGVIFEVHDLTTGEGRVFSGRGVVRRRSLRRQV
ncbi:MAG: hypothetical protein QG622_313 [Actinomycetota bacterium]|nr:hypothetical protein [Actinomycetota bacterium]